MRLIELKRTQPVDSTDPKRTRYFAAGRRVSRIRFNDIKQEARGSLDTFLTVVRRGVRRQLLLRPRSRRCLTMLHIVQSLGYDHCPEFRSLALARVALRDLVAEEFAACRRRFGEATRVKAGEDSYIIKIGGRDAVNVWSAHSIHTA